VELAEASTRDETLFPPKCCRQNFPTEDIIPYLSATLRPLFHAKTIEFGTPPDNRVYCPRPTCSAFLGSLDASQREIICEKCEMSVCSSCKNIAHPDEACAENAATLAVKALAKANKWPSCPGCHRIIELSQGCYHITCRCRTEFCYLCEERWKTCICPQWDEEHLVTAAEERVVDQFGARAFAAAPAALNFERIRQQIANLRVDHECTNHHWTYRSGGGQCRECHYHLPSYLLVSEFWSLHNISRV
jgi:hypothetical protein